MKRPAHTNNWKNIKYRFNAIKPEYPKGKNKVEVEKKKRKRRKNEAPQIATPPRKRNKKEPNQNDPGAEPSPPKKDPYINEERKMINHVPEVKGKNRKEETKIDDAINQDNNLK